MLLTSVTFRLLAVFFSLEIRQGAKHLAILDQKRMVRDILPLAFVFTEKYSSDPQPEKKDGCQQCSNIVR